MNYMMIRTSFFFSGESNSQDTVVNALVRSSLGVRSAAIVDQLLGRWLLAMIKLSRCIDICDCGNLAYSFVFEGFSCPDNLIRSMPVGKIFAGKKSAEFDSSSPAIAAASEKVLVPDNLDDGASLVTDELQGPTSFSEEPQVHILSSVLFNQ